MAEGRHQNSRLRQRLHIASYQDAWILAKCWLSFVGDGAMFVPAQPVRPDLSQTASVQILMLQFPSGEQYCVFARVGMILPAGTGPLNRGGYLMLIQKPPDAFLAAIQRCLDTEALSSQSDIHSIAQWLLSCADSESGIALQ